MTGLPQNTQLQSTRPRPRTPRRRLLQAEYPFDWRDHRRSGAGLGAVRTGRNAEPSSSFRRTSYVGDDSTQDQEHTRFAEVIDALWNDQAARAWVGSTYGVNTGNYWLFRSGLRTTIIRLGRLNDLDYLDGFLEDAKDRLRGDSKKKGMSGSSGRETNLTRSGGGSTGRRSRDCRSTSRRSRSQGHRSKSGGTSGRKWVTGRSPCTRSIPPSSERSGARSGSIA